MGLVAEAASRGVGGIDKVQRCGQSPRRVAGIAQLVERQLPKLDVAGSSPVARSKFRSR